MSEHNSDIVFENDEFLIIRLYACIRREKGLNGEEKVVFGDVFESMEEAIVAHPESEIINGFGIVNQYTGHSPLNSEDWYETFEDAKSFINRQSL